MARTVKKLMIPKPMKDSMGYKTIFVALRVQGL